MAELMVGTTQPDSRSTDGRILASGDESGTAPGDRPFRPDVEGLRAVAVLLVVLFHSDVPGFSGGFVGVDVFFVISGFVITGVLLRERASTGRTSILSFYGRRCRRIIPAATLVIIAAVVLAYWLLGVGGGTQTAIDGRWAAVFLANFHFIATGTNYLASEAPPSPLQNFWSLAVEEQFYVVYPTLFLLVAAAKVLTFRVRLAIGLVAVIVVSLTWSVIDTHNNSVDAFFSPFTRAWELALGALVAVATPWLLKVPSRMAAVSTWVGLAAVLVAAHVYSSQTPYPGAYVILPVVGTALIIGGGMRAHALAAELFLGRIVLRWLGKVSYSMYLWHWPILIIAAEYAGKSTLSVKDNLGWDLVALAISVATYRMLENPVRHSLALRQRRWASVGMGLGLVALTLVVIAVLSSISPEPADSATLSPSNAPLVPLQAVRSAVAASGRIRTVPSNLEPTVAEVQASNAASIGFPPGACTPSWTASSAPSCIFGDVRASRTIVLYGDSHAGMWFDALDGIATRLHWRLITVFKPGCPASLVTVPPSGSKTGDWTQCDQWHRFALRRIHQIEPAVIVISQSFRFLEPNGTFYPPGLWQHSVSQMLVRIAGPKTVKIVLGSPVEPAKGGPDCLSRHLKSVQSCTGKRDPRSMKFNGAVRVAATTSGARYINVVPWFCNHTCSSVIGNYEVYLRNDHVSRSYSLYLEDVLGKALDLPASG